ncbi:MAG: hypothetical protein H7A23_18875 [Leptospiraceae bacterium]|nr:hypothetical protein [Leptospiraceae bacterium]MCP5496617.1 hypothetical protein [Leptospiraceae bacterium]
MALDNTTRADAHKIFANLYRKKRDPEHQKKVDDIITRSNDIFIRIDLIKKLDEEFERSNARQIEVENAATKKVETAASAVTANKTVNKDSLNAGQQVSTDSDDKSSGLIDFLFGGTSAIGKFAKDSKALEIGLFGRKYTISKSVEHLFRYLKEDQIIATIQALKYCEQVGWKVWNPLIYNVVLNYNRFFNAFISLDSLFIDDISAEVFLGRSTKMQMYYIRMLKRPDTKEIILKNVPELIKTEDRIFPKMNTIMTGLTFGLSLENNRPTLTDALCAFHIVNTRKFVTWKEIEANLNVAPIDEAKYSGSPELSKQVEYTLSRITNEITTKLAIRNDIYALRNNFFKIGENGKLSFDFLNLVVDDYVSHHYPENMQTNALKSGFKTQPSKLLQLICRDLQSNYMVMAEGYIKVNKDGQTKDVLIFQPGLFFPEIERISSILRTLDVFNRKFSSFQYTFETFTQDVVKGSMDQIETQLLKILAEAADFLGKFAKKIHTIIENHEMAKEYEASDQANEKMLASKERVIEEVKPMSRFIPYGDAKIISTNRINGKTVYDALFELTRLLYNYAVIFKDSNTTSRLTAHKKLETEVDKLLVDYERMTGKPFDMELVNK